MFPQDSVVLGTKGTIWFVKLTADANTLKVIVLVGVGRFALQETCSDPKGPLHHPSRGKCLLQGQAGKLEAGFVNSRGKRHTEFKLMVLMSPPCDTSPRLPTGGETGHQ